MKPSFKSQLRAAATVAALLVLSGCTGMATQSSMNIYGAETDEATKARVERLMRYCEKLSKSGDYKLAVGLCTRAHDIDPGNPLPLMLAADTYRKAGDLKNEALAYEKILDARPNTIEAQYRLGKVQMDQGDNASAIETLTAALANEPGDTRILNTIAVIYDQTGQHDAAQAHYREALVLEPENLSVASNLGLSLALSGQREEAIAVLNKVVANPEASQVSHYNLALAYASPAETPEPNDAQVDDNEQAFGLEPVERIPLDQSSDRPGDSQAPYAWMSVPTDGNKRGQLVHSGQQAKAGPTPLVANSFAAVADSAEWDVVDQAGWGGRDKNGKHVTWQHYTPGAAKHTGLH